MVVINTQADIDAAVANQESVVEFVAGEWTYDGLNLTWPVRLALRAGANLTLTNLSVDGAPVGTRSYLGPNKGLKEIPFHGAVLRDQE